MTVKKRASDLSSLDRFNQYYRQTEEPLPRCQAVQRFIWNPKTRQFCGRTAASWSKIVVFYLVFYGVLALLVALCMFTFLQYINPREPKWKLDQSIIGTNPGLGFRPMPRELESTLIWYKGTQEQSYKYWKDELVDFLSVYKRKGQTAGAGQNIYTCDWQHPPPPGKVCDFDMRDWTNCIEESHFGYHKSTPCIFLKLNKIYGWRPEPYNESAALPAGMPAPLRAHIARVAADTGNNPAALNSVWVSCEGENPADREALGPVTYIPGPGFPAHYFPYQNAEGYLSPLVAIFLERPMRGILINVECRAWARNLRYDRHERLGSVHFELMID